jgi:ATP-dependent DNA helicase RecG
MRYPESKSSTLEFKKELPKNDQVIKTIVGFCNQNGGKLVIGVTDSGEIEGLSPNDLEHMLNSIEKAIFEATYPSIIPRICAKRFGEKNILEIEVSSGMNKPYYRKSEGMEKGTYIRLGSSTLRASAEIIQELEWQSRGISFESIPQYKADEKEISLKKVEFFLKMRKNRATLALDHNTLKAYRLTAEEHSKSYPTSAGLLLLEKTP